MSATTAEAVASPPAPGPESTIWRTDPQTGERERIFFGDIQLGWAAVSPTGRWMALFTARAGLYLLSVYHDGAPMLVRAIPGGADSFKLGFDSQGPGRYRLQVDRTLGGVASIEAVSTPIWLDPPG